MFWRTRCTIESNLDELKQEAMDAENYETVRKLLEIEKEIQSKVIWTHVKGIFGGYGAAMMGFAIGTVIVKNLRSSDT